ncbi:ABC transporter substrate-binding protein [Fischerella thermalis CCMEE 5205]|nr:ABC transporter substrate-binding protein [Fischerella thermalis CCMEE 5205]
MFLRRFVYLLFLGVLACLVFSACSKNANQIATSSKPLMEECRVVQHAMGKTCVPNHPKRFVALNPAALGNAIALGIQPIGSIFEYDKQFPDYLEGKTEGIEPLGEWAQPSIERIALLKPDIIISWYPQSIYPYLSAIAPTVLYDWGGSITQQNNWKQYFNFMAEVLNKKEIGEQVWQHYNQRIKQLKIALGDRYKNKTISFVNFCCGGMSSETENSFIGSILSDAGLQRPPSQRYNPQGVISFSEENLYMADGDVMFVVAYGGNETGERDLNILQKKPLWKKLKAVQENRVYYVDPTIWRGRTPLAADAVINDLYKYLINTP